MSKKNKKDKVIKNVKIPLKKEEKKEGALIPSKPSTDSVPIFTERAKNTSNSKRIRFLKAIEKLIPSVSSKPKTYPVSRLVEAEGVAGSLLPKVSKELNLSDLGIVLRATKDIRVEDKKNPLVSEVSLVKK